MKMKPFLWIAIGTTLLLAGCVNIPMHQQTAYVTIVGKESIPEENLIEWASNLNKALGLDFWRINPKDPEYFVIHEGIITTTKQPDLKLPAFIRLYYAQNPARIVVTYTDYSIKKKKGMNVPALKQVLELIQEEAHNIGTFQLSEWESLDYTHVDTDYF